MDEPVSLELAKSQCRIELDDTEENNLLAGYISAARAWVENESGVILVRRSLTEEFRCFKRSLQILQRPMVSVDAVRYFDPNEEEQTLADPLVRIGSGSTRIYPPLNQSWPAASRYGGVSVDFTAGFEVTAVPEVAVQAMLVLIAHWFRNREAVSIGIGSIVNPVPHAAHDLAEQLKVKRL